MLVGCPASDTNLVRSASMAQVSLDEEHRAAIGIVAGRIRRYGEAIAQGHTFGIEPGDHKELHTLAYQQAATPIYAETLPWSYLSELAAKFNEAAALMAVAEVPTGIDEPWAEIQSYLRSATTAITEAAPGPPQSASPEDIATMAPTTPPVMRFGHLARIAHPIGTKRLIESAQRVERACGDVDECPLSEQEKSWMQRIIAGERTLDIAAADGYSERSLYRALSELWDRLGVDNRLEAAALVTDNGWLD